MSDNLSVNIQSSDDVGVINVGAVDINHIYYPSEADQGIIVDFSYGDVSPKLLSEVLVNKLVLEVWLTITTPFNGVGSALSVGDADDHERFIPASYVDATQTFVVYVNPWHEYSVATEVFLYINPGTDPSAGAGTVRLVVEP